MRIALVESADAGRGGQSCLRGLRDGGVEVEMVDRETLDVEAVAGVDRMAVAGGDGSVGPAAAVAAAAGIPLAVIPTGTANNFADAEGLPMELGESCRLAAHGERTRPIELGRAGHVPFVNVASAGLAPVAAERAERWKRLLGPTAYVAGAVAAAIATPPLVCTVESPDTGAPVFAGRAWQVMVACSGAFGDGVRIERSDTGDGMLDLVAIAAGPRIELLRRGWWTSRGRIASQPGARSARGRAFDLSVPPGTHFNIDGEVVALGSARFVVEPGAFRLVVP